ncbi:MAG: helix-turn-helix transcriptional regulator [Longimicrobiales bacterium]
MSETQSSPVGDLLRSWRQARHMSQLDLALQAQVSTRHLSFIETGRSRPSREMVLRLSEVLDVPLRDRNTVLEAAGYARLYRETGLAEPQMDQVRRAVQFILDNFEPNAAVVLDHCWNIVLANSASAKLMAYLLGPAAGSVGPNLVRLLFDPQGLRPYVSNWHEVARVMVDRIHRESATGLEGDETRELLEDLLAYPGVPERWASPDLEQPLDLLIPIRFRKDEMELNFFTTITTLGTPQDVTLQELRIECLFPMDEASEKNLRSVVLS